jgi:signal transduction histidine kinase
MLSAAVTWVTTKQLRRSYDRERDAARVAWGALEARSRLLEIIAHDLRSPLAVVTLNADLLRRAQSDLLANLAGNAVKFTASGGRVQVCAFRAGDSVRLAVKDTGPGMDPEAQARVFERYWKGDAGGRKGAGLGLYIAKAIVDAHGGRLWLESQLGAGSTFYCDLPSAQAAPKPVQQPEPVRGAQARTS